MESKETGGWRKDANSCKGEWHCIFPTKRIYLSGFTFNYKKKKEKK